MLNFLIQASLMKAYTGRKMQKNAKQDRMRKLYLFYIRTVVLSFLPDLKVYTSLPSPSYGLHRPHQDEHNRPYEAAHGAYACTATSPHGYSTISCWRLPVVIHITQTSLLKNPLSFRRVMTDTRTIMKHKIQTERVSTMPVLHFSAGDFQ